jgi:hypothetical protein
MEATKQTMAILQGAAAFIPVPFLKEALELGLRVLKACEVCRTPNFLLFLLLI